MKKGLLFSLFAAVALAMPAQMLTGTDETVIEEIPLSSYIAGVNAPAKIAENGKPETSFARPNGVFYLGISGWMNSFLAYPSLFCPAFEPVTWVNTTPEGDNATFVWTYPTGEVVEGSPLTATSTDRDLVTFLPPSTSQSTRFDHNIQNALHPAPELTATANGQDSTFTLMLRHKAANNQRIIAGGECAGNPMTGTNYACNYDRYWNTGKRSYQPTLFALNADGADDWNTFFGLSEAKVEGLCEVFFKPQVPYTFNEANASFYKLGDTLGELKVTVREVELDDEGKVVALGKVRAEGISTRTYNLQNNLWISYIFSNLQETDPVTGQERDLLIDTPIMLTFGIANPEDTSTSLAVMYSIHPQYIANDNHAYALVSHAGEDAGRVTSLVSCNLHSTTGYTTTFNAGINACYNYLYVGEDDAVHVGDEPVQKTFRVNAYKPSTEWKITDGEGNELPNWISVACADSTQEAYGYQFITDVTVTVQPYQAGEARNCDINLAILGADDVIHVTRDQASAVASVKSGDTPVVVSADQSISVAGNKGVMTVFTIDGRVVAKASHSVEVPAGVYVVQVDGHAQKVIVR